MEAVIVLPFNMPYNNNLPSDLQAMILRILRIPLNMLLYAMTMMWNPMTLRMRRRKVYVPRRE